MWYVQRSFYFCFSCYLFVVFSFFVLHFLILILFLQKISKQHGDLDGSESNSGRFKESKCRSTPKILKDLTFILRNTILGDVEFLWANGGEDFCCQPCMHWAAARDHSSSIC